MAKPMQGIIYMVLATFIFALQDAVTKTLVSQLPVAQIVFVRFTAFAVMAILIAQRRSGLANALRSVRPKLQGLRCVLMVAEIALFAYALQFLGIAQMHAVFACFPLFVAVLSVPILGESVGWRRWLAVLVGFLGVLMILRPGTDVFNPYALLPLICALWYALYNVLTRKVSKHDSFITSLVYFGVVGMLASGAAAIVQWQPVSAEALRGLIILSVASIIAHVMLMKALQLTEAIVLQPFHYLVLPWAIILGYLLFGETLDVMTLVGAAVVIGSGVYVALREYWLLKSAAARVPA